MYKIICNISDQILKSDIKTLQEAQDIIKDYTENYNFYKKSELEIIKE